MARTLEELLPLLTKEDLRARLLLALQGVSFISKTGSGNGDLSADGVAAETLSVRILISTTGELGAGAFRVSTDGGQSYGSPITIPLGGTYAIPSSGVTITFETAPVGSTDASFIAGDLYAFELSQPTFEVTAWQPFSTGLTLVELDAQMGENFSAAQQKVAKGGFLLEATGDWLDLWLENLYDLSRVGGAATVGNVLLTDGGGGPFTISPGQLWVTTAGGLRFNNLTGGTLPLNGTLTLSFQAEKKGSQYNVGAGSINGLATALSGVTVSNPNPLGGSWITTPGADTESDSQAQKRALARWPALGVGYPKDIYLLWAVEASGGSVTRVLPRASPTVPGQIDVYLAGNGGSVSSPTVSAVQAYVDLRTGLTSVAVVASATPHNVRVAGTLYVKAGNAIAAAAAVSQNLSALFYSGTTTDFEEFDGIDIGGTVYFTEIIEEAMRAPGARNLVLTSPAVDVVLSTTEVAVLLLNIVTDGTGNPATDLCIVEY